MTKMGKTLVAARDLPAGHLLTAADIAVKSPGGGLPPSELDRLLGRRLSQALRADDMIRYEHLLASVA
jgi:N-acetylneuraminate synthase/sialic acid synthase